jgi:hypothetical protein
MALTYDDARNVALSASQAELDLPAYTGSTTDLGYLKNWVLNEVTSIYGVAANVFNEATIFSTSILRDFVHRALYETTDHPFLSDLAANDQLVAPSTYDVATGFRYPSYGECGLMAWQEYQVFTAFGYQSNILAVINGDMGVQGAPYSFTDGHATTEVYLSDYSKYIIQDATFNFLFEDQNGNPLSWMETRDAQYLTDTPPVLDSFNIYTYYRNNLSYMPDASQIEGIFHDGYLKVPQSWGSDGDQYGSDGMIYSLFPDWSHAHDPSVSQGYTFGTDGDAWTAIQSHLAVGESWSEIGTSFAQSQYYVSGFRIPGQGDWLTVRLSDGSYDSFEIHTGQILHGSYDQIVADATDGPSGAPRDLNPGTDLSFMLNPATLLSYTGSVSSPVTTSDDGNVDSILLHDPTTGVLREWTDMSQGPSAAHLLGAYDPSFDIISRGDYDGDGHADILWLNASVGRLGFTDSATAWHSLGSVGAGWSVLSQNGSANLTGHSADDILWQNSQSGEVGYWDMEGGSNQGYVRLDALSSSWKIVATNDFNGDGFDDVLWQNSSTGSIVEWQMHQGEIGSRIAVDAVAKPWTILDTGNILGDGASDLLWMNKSTGEVGLWDMSPITGRYQSFQHLDAIGTNWNVDAVVDLTGDGTADIVWQRGSQIVTWVMDDFSTTGHFDKVAAASVDDHWVIV